MQSIPSVAGITREAVTLSACRLFIASSKCSSSDTLGEIGVVTRIYFVE